MPRYPQYPFYVVMKNSGLVMAGADFREDAEEMRRDLPAPAQDMQVLTAAVSQAQIRQGGVVHEELAGIAPRRRTHWHGAQGVGRHRGSSGSVSVPSASPSTRRARSATS